MSSFDSISIEGSSSDISAGALGLLRDCVGGRAGERLLIVEEARGLGFYDDDAPQLTAQAARQMGMRVYETQAPAALASATDIASFIESLRGFDHVIFFARVGDQIRFGENPGMPPATMCYTLGRDMLDSAFGTACYQGLCEVKQFIDQAISNATLIRVTCPRGTDYTGRPRFSEGCNKDVSLKRFPMLVPKPVPASGFSGRVVLSRFLLGTGSHYYEPYSLSLNDDVNAIVENNRLVRFEGKAQEVARVNAHYEDIAKRYSVDPWYVHSWHAGIHPACTFPDDAEHDLIRWSGSAFGNPRVLHFHTCGDYAPGEISWTVLDPTIYLDGVPVWQRGNLHPERLPGGENLLTHHPRLADMYRMPLRNIGIGDP